MLFVSVTQLNFDQYESPETPAFSPGHKNGHKKKRRKDPFRDASDDYMKTDESEMYSSSAILDIYKSQINYLYSHSCPICQKYFSARKKVKLHVKRVHKQIKDHNCDECEYKAHTKWDILRHIKTNHLPPDPDPKDFRICPDCGKVLKVILL